MTPKETLAFCRENDVRAVALKFTDFFGQWGHTTIPFSALSEATFDEGIVFDGSNVQGWQRIEESDMLLVPVADNCFLDPFTQLPTLNLICNVVDPSTQHQYSRDPRHIARKAVEHLRSTGIAQTAYFGPEVEFFIFDDVRFSQDASGARFEIDSMEAEWNRAREESPNLSSKIQHQRGYMSCPPADQTMDLRNEIMQALMDSGVTVERQQHAVATAGQAEIDLRYAELVQMADQVMTFKHIVKNVARKHQKTVTFMPKPILGDAGSGMHIHFSLWNDDQPLFSGDQYAGLSEMAMHAVGGILKHARSLLAITNPTTNSYRRLVPGFEAPVNLSYSQRNRSASCRIPLYSSSAETRRIEFRCPDPTCNPYLAFPAVLMAALDGIENKIDPGQPIDELSKGAAEASATPVSLRESLDALEADHEYLMRGDVFTLDVIENWIEYKRIHEVDALARSPHPWEFCWYYNA